MASQPLPRFLEQHDERRRHVAKLTQVVAQDEVDIREKKIYHDPADALTLRGIPAIGRGVAGVIRGTAPGAAG